MRKYSYFLNGGAILWMLSLVFIPGCSHTDVKNTAQGIVLVPAFVVAVPTAAAYGAYREVSGTEKRDELKRKQVNAELCARFDPIYEKRIAVIEAHDPIKDADAVYFSGTTAFLSGSSGWDDFCGLIPTWNNPDVPSNNWVKIRENPITNDMQALLCEGPASEIPEGFTYSSPIIHRFRKVAKNYIIKFNERMMANTKAQK